MILPQEERTIMVSRGCLVLFDKGVVKVLELPGKTGEGEGTLSRLTLAEDFSCIFLPHSWSVSSHCTLTLTMVGAFTTEMLQIRELFLENWLNIY